MNKALLDTNIVSAFMRDTPQVVEKMRTYLQHHETVSISPKLIDSIFGQAFQG